MVNPRVRISVRVRIRVRVTVRGRGRGRGRVRARVRVVGELGLGELLGGEVAQRERVLSHPRVAPVEGDAVLPHQVEIAPG